MLLTKEVKIKWQYCIKKYYESKGYIFTNYNEEFLVNIKDLNPYSRIKIQVSCDNKDCTTPLTKLVKFDNYNNYLREDGNYYCHTCAMKLYANKNSTETKLKNGKSFEQWCLENNRLDILNRWDYELNKINPNEICYSTNKKYYFKCPKNKHLSEIKSIHNFVRGQNGSMQCIFCGSFAEYIIEIFGEKAIEKYWSKENDISPYKIYKSSKKEKVLIICDKEFHHGSYLTTTDSFVSGSRCPKCKSSKGEGIIENYLIDNNIIYIYQKLFEGLVGVKNKNLSYDFYLPDYNLLIEYQGEQHEKAVDFIGEGIKIANKKFIKQQEHDRRKKEYANNKYINLLEIWYWDFDNIELILEKELSFAINKDMVCNI